MGFRPVSGVDGKRTSQGEREREASSTEETHTPTITNNSPASLPDSIQGTKLCLTHISNT